MDYALPWILLRFGRSAPCQDVRWKPLLHAALATPYYANHPSRASIEMCLKSAPRAVLSRVAPLALREFYQKVHEFHNPAAPLPTPRTIEAPWAGSSRVVAVQAWFPLDSRIVHMSHFAPDQLTAASPESIAAPVAILRQLAAMAIETGFRLPSLRHGILALISVGRPCLTQADRDLFWHAFQVPVYEQFRGFHGELLAMECARHQGLHVQPDSAVFETEGADLLLTSLANLRYPTLRLATGISGILDPATCPCGLSTPRLRHLALAARATLVPDVMMATRAS
ncbi:MAG: hypothetical protein JJE04_07530 [Acidobacteriia bacterium]|nr:hypothetical protein [Terriglobia bacterium]